MQSSALLQKAILRMSQLNPSKRCPMCKEKIQKLNAPMYKGLEYCSADCAIEAWEKDKAK